MMNTKTFTTTNRELENFFFMHNIRFLRFWKGDDLLTVWEYEDTPYLREVLAEYAAIIARRPKRTA